MEKRSPFDPDGDTDRDSDGFPVSSGIEAIRQQARIEHFHWQEENARASAEWHACASRGHVSAF